MSSVARFSCGVSVSHTIFSIAKGIEKLSKMTPKIVSFIILFTTFIYYSFVVFNNDFILIKKQYKNTIKIKVEKMRKEDIPEK